MMGAIHLVRAQGKEGRGYEYIVHGRTRRRGAKLLFRTYARRVSMDHYNINLVMDTLQVLNTLIKNRLNEMCFG